MNPRGHKNGTGTQDSPFQAIQAAVERSSSGDVICLQSGDYELNNDIVIAEMAVLHIAAFTPSKRPHLIDFGIQLQAEQSMISNFTLTDVIIESSRPLRIIGTVNDITIARTDFLMMGQPSDPAIRLDRVKLGGDGTDPPNVFNGIRFIDCVFDTRDSYTVDMPFFSWKRMVSPLLDAPDGSGLLFQNVTMRGGLRGPLTMNFEKVPNVGFLNCSFSQGALVTATEPVSWTLAYNTFDAHGIAFFGNITQLNICRNEFKNFGRKLPFLPTRPSSIHFIPNADDDVSRYEDIDISGNTFTNYTRTTENGAFLYAAIDFTGDDTADFLILNVAITNNNFAQLTPSLTQKREEYIKVAPVVSNPWAMNRTGPWAIYNQFNKFTLNCSFNYYGMSVAPSSCCNPESLLTSPQVSPRLEWSPWCVDKACTQSKSSVAACDSCQPKRPSAPTSDETGLVVVIVVASTLALIVVIVGITAVYCFLRPKAPNQYSLLPTDGWRSRLLASVPDVQALFDQFGVPLIHYEHLALNASPIGTGSFGVVYDGLLHNADHIVLHQEMHTLADHDTITRGFSDLSMHYGAPLPDITDDDEPNNKKRKKKPAKQEEASEGLFSAFLGFFTPSSSNTAHAEASSSASTLAPTTKTSTPTKDKKSKKSKKDEPRPIAVKVLNSAITDTYEDMTEFLEEIKIMASIDHPNLLKLRGVAIDPISENIMLVMDLMDMGSLDDVIFRRKVPMSFARKIAIATEIGYALHYLHSKEPAICHRDLKPGNVLVSRKWTIKVCDFGSSRVLDRKTATMTLKGTPIYLAPESLNSSKFSEKSDVYSYGITLVELFGGQRAFDDVEGSAQNLMIRIAVHGLRPTIPRELPPSLKSLIRRCMATDPEERPNFTDILEKLAEVRAASADLTPAQIAELPAPESADSSMPSSPISSPPRSQ